MDFYQHGDVLIFRVDGIPEEAKKIDKRPLAYGEKTGHAHTVVEDCEMFERDGVLYMSAKTPVKVSHQEHKEITLPKGNYRIGIVKEYDHFAEEARKVMD